MNFKTAEELAVIAQSKREESVASIITKCQKQAEKGLNVAYWHEHLTEFQFTTLTDSGYFIERGEFVIQGVKFQAKITF